MSGMRLLSVGLLGLRPIRNPLSNASVVGYRTKGGHDVAPELYPETPNDRRRGSRAIQVQRAEEVEDEFSLENPNFFSDSLSDEIKRQKRVKFKIIERKYFKPSQETNLLTWDAKEQVRYLHQEFPKEWTVERLTESFPTSREGVIKILKSSWKPTTLKEVVRHDRRVQRAWLEVAENNKGDGPVPLQSRYQKLLEDGRLGRAAGIHSLPAPTPMRLLTDSEAAIPPRLPLPPDSPLGREKRKGSKKYNRSVGPFESLVKDYCEKKDLLKAKHEQDPSNGYEKHKKQSMGLLQQIVVEKAPVLKSSKSMSDFMQQLPGDSLETSQSVDRQGTPGQQSSRTSKRSLFDQIQEGKAEMAFSKQAEAILRGEAEIPDNEENTVIDAGNHPLPPSNNSHRGHRKSLRRQRTKDNFPCTSNSLDRRMEELQMEGTGKINPEDDTTRPNREDKFSDDEYGSGRGRVKRFELDKDKAAVLSRVRFDTPRLAPHEEAYIYTESAGYQYPLGRTDQHLKVDILSRPGDPKPKLYQKGKDVYDADGELLYRIP